MEFGTMAFEFQYLFRQWSTWYRLRRTCAWMLKGLIFGLSLALGFSLVALAKNGLIEAEFLTIVTRFSLLSTVAAGLAGLVWPVTKQQLAIFFDGHFGLQERSSTALEILQRINLPSDYTHPDHTESNNLILKQLQDTLLVSSRVRLTARFFFHPDRLQGLMIGGLILGIVLLGSIGEPLFEGARQQRQIRQAITQEAARLEALAEQIQDNEKISSEQRQQINQALEEAVKHLNEAQTTEQALAVLTSTEKQLQSLNNTQAQEQAENLQNAGKRLLEENPAGSNTPLASFAQNLSVGDYLAAAQDLANLDLSQLSAEEANSLADQLEQASQIVAETNPDLSQSLAEAAQALRDGNTQVAQQALQEAAQAVANTGQQIAQAQAARQVAAQISQGQGRLIQAGSGQSQEAQAGTAGQTGSEQGNQGQASGSQPGSTGENAGGNGAGEGESAGEAGEGPEAGANPIGQNNQAGDGGIQSYEEIYAPQRLGGTSNDEIALPESDKAGDQVIGEGAAAPGDSNPSYVPYIDVLPNYTEAYRRAIESGKVPASLQQLVKKYFSSLEP
jgi:hypothetical protein